MSFWVPNALDALTRRPKRPRHPETLPKRLKSFKFDEKACFRFLRPQVATAVFDGGARGERLPVLGFAAGAGRDRGARGGSSRMVSGLNAVFLKRSRCLGKSIVAVFWRVFEAFWVLHAGAGLERGLSAALEMKRNWRR